jgi:hypothetical protein
MADSDGSVSPLDGLSSSRTIENRGDEIMNHRIAIAGLLIGLGTLIPSSLPAQTEKGPYARIGRLHPREGSTVEWEAGYVRHLEWHRQVKDNWTWYGWTVADGERQRWFVYATFGHSGASLDRSFPAAEDERDAVLNIAPHLDVWEGALYEFLPALSRGTGVPRPTALVEITTVELAPGSARDFESALAARQPRLENETLWYRMVAGGKSPRYVRLRPRPNLETILRESRDEPLPDGMKPAVPASAEMTVEILALRPTLSYGLGAPSCD